jgi:hypothetical protein
MIFACSRNSVCRSAVPVVDRLSPHLCQASHTQGGKARVEHQPVIRFSVGLKDLVSIV